MTRLPTRSLLTAALLAALFALPACSTTPRDPNLTDKAASSRVDAALDRAAREAKASGNKVETLELMEKIYARNPKDPAVAVQYSQALREDDQLNRAREVVSPFTSGKDAYPDAVVELSMTQLSLGQYEEAEDTARRAVAMDPKSGRAYLALGTALDAQNQHEEAETALRKGIDNWKGDPAPIMNNLALNLAAQSKLDQAYAMLVKAKEISPGRVEIERNLRIIGTLREGADDFFTKGKGAKTASADTKQTDDAPTAKSDEKKADAKPAKAADKKPE